MWLHDETAPVFSSSHGRGGLCNPQNPFPEAASEICFSCFAYLFDHMESEGLLNIENDLHMFVLRYVFEARINTHLQDFTEG